MFTHTNYDQEQFLALIRYAARNNLVLKTDVDNVLVYTDNQYRLYYCKGSDYNPDYGVAYDVITEAKNIVLSIDDDRITWTDHEDTIHETELWYHGIQKISGENVRTIAFNASLTLRRLTFTPQLDVWFYDPMALINGLKTYWKKDMAPATIAASIAMFLCLEDKFPEKTALDRLVKDYTFTKAPRATEEAAIVALKTLIEDMYEPDDVPENILNYHGYWVTYQDKETKHWYAGTIMV